MTIKTTITRKYLLGKSKSDLAYMYLELLERAVQAEAERDAAQARSGGKSIALEDLRDELERVKAERNALVTERERLLEHVEYLVREGQKAEADARALAKIANEVWDPNIDERDLIAQYLEAK